MARVARADGDARRRQILDAARRRAEESGWPAVTTRHLADAIGFTQPVLYGHFPGGKREIMLAIALEGFAELSRQCRTALESVEGADRVAAVAEAYLAFAAAQPAVYTAMFSESIDAPFATDETRAELREGFDTLAAAIGDAGDGTATEVLWSALHGMSLLERDGRVRPAHRVERIAELASRFPAR